MEDGNQRRLDKAQLGASDYLQETGSLKVANVSALSDRKIIDSIERL